MAEQLFDEFGQAFPINLIPASGGVFEVTSDTRIALTGAPMRAEVDGAALVWNASHLLPKGARVRVLLEDFLRHELLQRGAANRAEELRLELYDKVNRLGIGAQAVVSARAASRRQRYDETPRNAKDKRTHAAPLVILLAQTARPEQSI